MKPRKRDQINGEMDTLWILKFYDTIRKIRHFFTKFYTFTNRISNLNNLNNLNTHKVQRKIKLLKG